MLRLARVRRVFARVALLDLRRGRALARLADRVREGDVVVAWVVQTEGAVAVGWGAVRVYPTALVALASLAVWVGVSVV